MVKLVRQTGSLAGNGNMNKLGPRVQSYIQEKAALCQPDSVHVCDGSDEENARLMQLMQKEGTAVRVAGRYNNWYANLLTDSALNLNSMPIAGSRELIRRMLPVSSQKL